MEQVKRAPTKAQAQARVREVILAMCDPDISEKFENHYYTIEPLLMQIIRELRKVHDYEHIL